MVCRCGHRGYTWARLQSLSCLVLSGYRCNGNESAPIQLAQCRFPGLAISNDEMLIYFLNKIYVILSNSTRKLVWFETAKILIAVPEKNIILSFIIIFGTLSFPITLLLLLFCHVTNKFFFFYKLTWIIDTSILSSFLAENSTITGWHKTRTTVRYRESCNTLVHNFTEW